MLGLSPVELQEPHLIVDISNQSTTDATCMCECVEIGAKGLLVICSNPSPEQCWQLDQVISNWTAVIDC